jgi:CO dehydrogenase/acetyl-CoA synthase beta subunit
MKTKEIKKQKSILTDLREIRDKISNELAGKTTEEIVEYLKKKKTFHPSSTWQ